ncbi:serine hydrolase domain-containing protein [Schleiferilactobacillus shenzhenensis]|uniref:Beta-lactamase-related domain-containing protein n=1 Tax=Schleiferilactobacillus shenzhenensis LY-73 TaxID=1231336 RepID=U4TKE2_9LACO|nr:serine hydrolase domain-containing protein [Schleiferilactobacillus shenzhenensis]ERL64679.1 hypothetical protein L248_0736 [Schleiferilactobacillus shenzhenensis LY-73]
MKRMTTLLIGFVTGALLVGCLGAATYYGYVRPRHVAEVKREAEKDAADRSSLSRRASELTAEVNEKKTTTAAQTSQPGQTSVNKLSSTAEATLTKRLQDEQFVGTLLLVKDGQIIYNQGFGYADAAKKRLNTPQSLFQIGSAQKSLTATLIAQLIAAGKLHYTDNVHQYYDQIPAARNITIRQLLDMTSGLKMDDAVPKTVMTDTQIVQRALTRMEYLPENQGHEVYQAVNYVLLAGIINQLTGQSYEQNVQAKLFQPLGITSSQAGFMWDFANQSHRTTSYVSGGQFSTYQKIAKESVADMYRELGTGNIYATPYTFFRLQQAIIQGKYVDRAAVATLRDSTDGEYGGGVYSYPTYIYSHGVKNWQELIMTISTDGNSGVMFMSNRAYDYDQARARAAWYWQFLQNAQVN